MQINFFIIAFLNKDEEVNEIVTLATSVHPKPEQYVHRNEYKYVD